MTDQAPAMTSHRPYLLRALYEWIADNGMTPHILVDARRPGVRVPAHAVQDGRVVLNIADRAVARLEMDNDSVRFSARFGGVSQSVVVPIAAVLAVYARETGQGMALPEDIVASGDDDAAPAGETQAPTPARPAFESVDGGATDRDADADGPPDDTPPEPRRGHLRVIK
ncbi:ClpXP protease specificity-enhancing factor [Luteimonas sp. FCS-9]|uniref:ClpXP protease specificity-enhancing factor n=1 Tax=Luteimonas sp. FCS-9 TaxID=1547516 RepID=UPI00063EAF96|nr:ClpXP protease specificity-enhancing factor [Luteimonas sp. FCS-9]KLJ01070.1 peptidase [Luteimonas sp. FCS-9]